MTGRAAILRLEISHEAPVAELPIDEREGERLQQLLALEKRLQDLVRAAREDAARRIASARAAMEQRLLEAREAAERADAEGARAERVSHEETLSAVEAAHRGALAAIASLSDERVDELARWAVARAIGDTGEPA
jgi:hypothetical protein